MNTPIQGLDEFFTQERVIATFRVRLLDMLTDPASALIWDDEERARYADAVRLPRIPLFVGAFHAACDDHAVARDERDTLMDRVFEKDR